MIIIGKKLDKGDKNYFHQVPTGYDMELVSRRNPRKTFFPVPKYGWGWSSSTKKAKLR